MLDDLLLPDGCHVGIFFDMPLSEMVACKNDDENDTPRGGAYFTGQV